MTDLEDIQAELAERAKWGESRTDWALRAVLRWLRNAESVLENMRVRTRSSEVRLTELEARVARLEPPSSPEASP